MYIIEGMSNDTIIINSHRFAKGIDENIVSALMQASTLKAHDDKAYNQRTATLSIAHVRHCVGQVRKHNDFYGDIITLGDMAMKLPECKIELRLAIYGAGMQDLHYSTRGVAVQLAKWAAEFGMEKAEEAVAAEVAAE